MRLAIVVEAPSSGDTQEGRLLSDHYGIETNNLLKRFDLNRNEVYVTHAVACRLKWKMPAADIKKAVKCCKPRLDRELSRLPKSSVVIAFGAWPLYSLADTEHYMRWWGWPYKWEPHVIFPMFPPELMFRGKPQYLPLWIKSFDRALSIADGYRGEKWPQIYTDGDGIDKILAAFDSFEQGKSVAMDIESGDADPFTRNLLCVGIANGEVAVSLDWPMDEDVYDKFQRLLSNDKVEKIFQNGSYDAQVFRSNGMDVAGYTADTLVGHNVIDPLCPHDLDFLGASYLWLEHWKSEHRVFDDVKGSARFAKAKDNETKWDSLKTYNAKDAAATYKIWHKMRPLIKSSSKGRGWRHYETLMKLNDLGMKMKKAGVLVCQDSLQAHRKRLQLEIGIAEEQARHFFGDINLNSGQQVIAKMSEQYEYRSPKQTPTGKDAIDKEVLENIVMTEDGELQQAAVSLLRYRMWTKDLSTYVDGLPIFPDGRVHPNWRPGLLTTFRWACTKPSMQVIPKPVVKDDKVVRPGLRDIFIPTPGSYLVEADYSQLELRIIAWLAQDDKLTQAYLSGADVHQLNADTLGCPRKLAKTFVYLTNYRGGPRKGAKGMVKEGFFQFTGSKGIELFRSLQEKWFEDHRAIWDWQDKVIEEARITGNITLPISGRQIQVCWPNLSLLIGLPKPTDCANYPVQGTAADIVNAATLRVDARLEREKAGRIIIQLHDALVVEGPDPERLATILREEMTATHTVATKTMTFPVDVSVGKDWGNMEEV